MTATPPPGGPYRGKAPAVPSPPPRPLIVRRQGNELLIEAPASWSAGLILRVAVGPTLLALSAIYAPEVTAYLFSGVLTIWSGSLLRTAWVRTTLIIAPDQVTFERHRLFRRERLTVPRETFSLSGSQNLVPLVDELDKHLPLEALECRVSGHTEYLFAGHAPETLRWIEQEVRAALAGK